MLKRVILFLIFALALYHLLIVDSRAQELRLKKPSELSGDNQSQSVGTSLKKPIRILVVNSDGKPVPNIPIVFENLSYPENTNGLFFSKKVAISDSLGIASIKVKLDYEPGEYSLVARIKDSASSEFLIYHVGGRQSNWVLILIIGVLGGLTLFLVGMGMMSDGLQKSAGDKLRAILGNITKNRLLAYFTGAFVTMIIQSSSATAVMLISFVNSKLMRFNQTLGVILGAAIGTSITAQLIAFRFNDYALLFVALGFIIQAITKNDKLKYTGGAILGFGLLFYGMAIMSEAMAPMRTFEPFLEFLVKLKNPLLGILVGTIFTALIQSPSAFIGIMIILASQGLLSLEASIPLLLGANLGASVSGIIAAMNASTESKKVAMATTFFKLSGIILIIWWIPDFVKLVKFLSPASENADTLNATARELPRQIANAHTIGNLLVAAVLLPFLNNIAKIIDKIIKPKPEEESVTFKTKYLKEDLKLPPALALSVIKQEVVHMAHIVQTMVNIFLNPFIKNEKPDIKLMQQKEDEVDFLRDRINNYLISITGDDMEKGRFNEAFQILYTVKEFEKIADIIYTIYTEKGPAWISKNLEFSDQGKKELEDYHIQVQKQISRAIEVFKDINLEKAQEMKEKHKKYRQMEIDLEKNHYQRLINAVDKSVKTSETHLELMTSLATIHSYATNVARIILEWTRKD